jgi:nitroreductase/NAD-dependent dihydropyrimidine dehydrogenase PreA subunit
MKEGFFMNNTISIDKSLCTSCGKCVRECGNHIQIQNGSHVDPANVKCSQCYHCYTVCPRNAIKLKQAGDSFVFDPHLFNTITEENLTHFLAYRRSIRSFQTRAVEDSIVTKLVDRARYIPSGGNSHSYEFTVLKSDAVKARIREELIRIYKARSLILNNTLLRNAAKPFVNKQMRGFLNSRTYGDRMKDLLQRIFKGEDPFFYHAPAILVLHSKEQIPTPKEDCVLAGYNICLVAQTLGLGTCYVTLAQNAFNSSKKCKEILGLTPEDNVNAVIILGYPAVQHERIAPKPQKEIHWC